MLTFVALLSVRTTLAAFADVIALYDLIAVLCFPFTVIGMIQPFAVWASEVISDLIITEVFNAVNILLVFLRFADLIVGRLDVRVLSILFQISVVLLAGISRVGYDVCIFPSDVISQTFQKRYDVVSVGLEYKPILTMYSLSTPI